MSRPIRLRSRAIVLFTAIAAAIPFLMIPAAAATARAEAAHPVKPFNAEYGNTYSRGQVTFYNRSVSVDGEHKAVGSSGCRYTQAKTFTASGVLLGTGTSTSVCDSSEDFSFPVTADVPGGASRVDVYLKHLGTGQILDTVTVWRLP